jgi:hypothetical protein
VGELGLSEKVFMKSVETGGGGGEAVAPILNILTGNNYGTPQTKSIKARIKRSLKIFAFDIFQLKCRLCIYLFTVYLITLSVTQIIVASNYRTINE